MRSRLQHERPHVLTALAAFCFQLRMHVDAAALTTVIDSHATHGKQATGDRTSRQQGEQRRRSAPGHVC